MLKKLAAWFKSLIIRTKDPLPPAPRPNGGGGPGEPPVPPK